MKKIIPKIYTSSCKEALDYYQHMFGGEIKNVQTTDDNPLFQNHKGKILRGELDVSENCIFYFSDIFHSEKEVSKNSLSIEFNTKEELTKVYESFLPDSQVTYKLQKTFWGAYHAVFTDKYGNEWELNCDER